MPIAGYKRRRMRSLGDRPLHPLDQLPLKPTKETIVLSIVPIVNRPLSSAKTRHLAKVHPCLCVLWSESLSLRLTPCGPLLSICHPKRQSGLVFGWLSVVVGISSFTNRGEIRQRSHCAGQWTCGCPPVENGYGWIRKDWRNETIRFVVHNANKRRKTDLPKHLQL